MIRYLKHHHVNKNKYDHCVRMDPLGLPYAHSWYLNTVCENWDALVLNDYDAVWPLPVRTKWGFKYFYRPFAVQQLGVFSKKALSEEELHTFVDNMQQHCHFADLYLNEGQLLKVSTFKHIRSTLQLNLGLSLACSFREIYHGYSNQTRRNLKRAAKGDLQLFEKDGPERIINIFEQNKGEKLALPANFYSNMKKVMYRCIHNDTGKLWTVYGPGNRLCAGIFVVTTGGRHTLLFTALTAEGKEWGAMPYLINEYLIFQSGKASWFDFEGSNLPGLARFYKGFGAQDKRYLRLIYNGLPLPLRWLKS